MRSTQINLLKSIVALLRGETISKLRNYLRLESLPKK